MKSTNRKWKGDEALVLSYDFCSMPIACDHVKEVAREYVNLGNSEDMVEISTDFFVVSLRSLLCFFFME
jgi:hypothetical protein